MQPEYFVKARWRDNPRGRAQKDPAMMQGMDGMGWMMGGMGLIGLLVLALLVLGVAALVKYLRSGR